MNKRIYKLSEEQYSRLMEDDSVYSGSDSNNQPQTVVKTTRNGLSNATSKALETNASEIEITDNNNVNENLMSKKELVAEARREWKANTKVVKLSELLKK